MDKFIELFCDTLDIVDPSTISGDTLLHSLDEWNSMAIVSIVVLADEEYGKTISPESIKACETICALFNTINS